MTFARAYVNQENPYTYANMFREVFRIVGSLCQTEVKWRHLHGTGLGALVMDMDSKQLSGNILLIYYQYITNIFLIGFGHYLSELDPQHRPWQWHIKRTVVYCTIHFERGIVRAAGTEGGADTPRTRMKQLPFCQSKDDYYSLTTLLKSTIPYNIFLIYY